MLLTYTVSNDLPLSQLLITTETKLTVIHHQNQSLKQCISNQVQHSHMLEVAHRFFSIKHNTLNAIHILTSSLISLHVAVFLSSSFR